MHTGYKVISPDGVSLGDADSIDGVVEVVRSAAPGRYVVQRVSFDPDAGETRSWDWGAITKSRKGKITLDLPTWID